MFLGIYRGRCSSEYTEGHVPRNIPRDMFLGIYRGTCSSEYSEERCPSEYSEERCPSVYSERVFINGSIDGCKSKNASIDEYPDEDLPRIPSEISEGFPRKEEIPRNYFRGLVSSLATSVRLSSIPRHDLSQLAVDDWIPLAIAACFPLVIRLSQPQFATDDSKLDTRRDQLQLTTVSFNPFATRSAHVQLAVLLIGGPFNPT
ncbi:hypothetical protein F2Q69_00027385 [Brassica cretica]|uniref:Uncharacterized protein n=1 Tax=Brassica cretica TaxID=69181 RepID=A0A8S9RW86_BRACR|nr:hypothetical protein F2Q69_00027385 [Brassica cretica]